MRKYILIAVLIFTLFSQLAAQSKVGTTAGNFLLIAPGSRGLAMGEAVSASARDISSMYYNPALGASLPGSEVYFAHIDWFADIDLNYGSAMINMGNYGNIAASFFILNSGEIEVTTDERQDGTGELYTVQDMVAALSYCRALTNRFSIGGSIKYINSSIWNMSASTFALDLGLTYKTPYEPFVVGFSINNFGGEMRMFGTDNAIRVDPDPRVDGNNDGIVGYQSTKSWDLPVNFRVGMAWNIVSTAMNQITLCTDALYPNNNDNYVNMGMEYGFKNMYFIRGGYRQIFLDDAEGNLTFGGGFKIKNILFDYTYSDRDNLNSVQYISLGMSF